MTASPNDLTRPMLAVLFIGGLIALSFRVIRRFAASIVWAATLVQPSWPLMRRLERSPGRCRWAAVTIPLSIAISSMQHRMARPAAGRPQ